LTDWPRLAEEQISDGGVNKTVIYLNASAIENEQRSVEVKVKSDPKPHSFKWLNAEGDELNASIYQPWPKVKQSNVSFFIFSPLSKNLDNFRSNQNAIFYFNYTVNKTS
jgi:hypothetical protein